VTDLAPSETISSVVEELANASGSGPGGYPTAVVLDREMRIRGVVEGFGQDDAIDAVVAATAAGIICGDSELDAGEECDDGNHDTYDSCDNECRLHVCTTPADYGTTTCEIAYSFDTGSSSSVGVGCLLEADSATDYLFLELREGVGYFTGGLTTGTFALTGDELNPQTCSVCLELRGDYAASGSARLLPTEGTVRIDSTSPNLDVTLEDVRFQEVYTDPDTSDVVTHRADCTSDIGSVNMVVTP
jgi:hypothetical protein